MNPDEIILWQPIRTSPLLGWVRLKVSLLRSRTLQQEILTDNILVAVVALLIDLMILLAVLYLPGKSFRRAVGFAQSLTTRPGNRLDVQGGSREINALVDALNVSSADLKRQRDLLDRQHHQLADLNRNLERRVQERTEELIESRKSLVQLHQAVTQSSVGIVMLDNDFCAIDCNPAFQVMTGFDCEKIVVQDVLDLLWSKKNPRWLMEEIRESLKCGKPWRGELTIHHASGDGLWVQMVLTPVRDELGELYYLLTMDDISERKAYEKQLIHQANYDALTGLPNRVLGMDRLRQAIRVDQRKQRKTIVLYLDLDRFKQVNDSLGHRIGDLLLIETAGRLTACVRQYDTVSRLSGDEFLIVLSGVEDAVMVESTAEKILHMLAQPYQIEDRELHVGASIGIAVIPDDGQSADDILRYADTAMYQAKQAGRNHFKYYTQSMNEAAQQRLRIDTAMHTALENGELQLHLQPVVTPDGKPAGAEALMRWRSAALGPVMPDVFIPIAEENGLIVPMGQ